MAKRILILIALFIISWTSFIFAGENTMKLRDADGLISENITLELEIINEDEFTDYQVDIVLPSGFNYISGSGVVLRSAFVFQSVFNVLEGNILRIVVVSGPAFSGNDGPVATFELTTPGSADTYVFVLQDAIIGNALGQNIITGTIDGTVTLNACGELIATITSTNVTCNGADNGIITISDPLGADEFEYRINEGVWQSANTFTGLAPGTYDVYIRDAVNTDCEKLLEEWLEITEPAALLAGSINADQFICYNTAPDALISVEDATGGTSPLTYQWQYRVDDGDGGWTDWANVLSGGTGNEYEPDALTVTTQFRRLVDDDNDCGPEYSNVVTITVYPEFMAGAIETTGEEICYNTNPTVEIGSLTAASGGFGAISYQWQSSTTSATEDFANITDATDATYTPADPLTQTTWYRRLAKDATCEDEFIVSDGVWEITVNPLPDEKTVQASTIKVCYNANAFISVLESQTDVSYQLRNDADDTPIGDPVIGDGNTISLSTGPLTSETTFNVLATLGDCSIELDDKPTVDVWPATLATDYFRSVATSGNWNDLATWESSPDNAIWCPATIIPSSAAESVTIADGTTVTINVVSTAKNIIIEDGATLNAQANLTVAGNWTNNGIFDPGNSLVTFSGSAPHAFAGNTTFNNLTVSGNTNFGSTTITIMNNFIASGGTMGAGTSTFIFKGAAGTIGGGNAKNFFNLQIDNGAVIGTSGGGNIFIAGDYTNDGTFTQEAARNITFNGSPLQTLSGSGTTVFGNYIQNLAKTVDASAHSFTIAGTNFDVQNASGIFKGDGGNATVTFSGNVVVGSGAGTITFNNLLISGSLANTSNKNFSVKGDWTNNGTYTPGTGTILFNGDAAQTLGGTSETEFYSITVNNTAGLILAKNQSVSNQLTLFNGIVTTGENLLTVPASGNIAGGSATAYVNGKLARGFSTTGSRQFPVGKAGKYRPVTLQYATLDNPSTVTTEVLTGIIPGNVSSSITLFEDRYWKLTQDGATIFSYFVTFDDEDFNPNNPVYMLKGDGTNIIAYATTAPDYTNVAAFTAFSDFGLGEENCVLELDQPENVIACDSYTLPTITGTNLVNPRYFNNSQAEGGTEITNLTLTTTQTVWIYSETGTVPNCFDEVSFTVTINNTPDLSSVVTDIPIDFDGLCLATSDNLAAMSAAGVVNNIYNVFASHATNGIVIIQVGDEDDISEANIKAEILRLLGGESALISSLTTPVEIDVVYANEENINCSTLLKFEVEFDPTKPLVQQAMLDLDGTIENFDFAGYCLAADLSIGDVSGTGLMVDLVAQIADLLDENIIVVEVAGIDMTLPVAEIKTAFVAWLAAEPREITTVGDLTGELDIPVKLQNALDLTCFANIAVTVNFVNTEIPLVQQAMLDYIGTLDTESIFDFDGFCLSGDDELGEISGTGLVAALFEDITQIPTEVTLVSIAGVNWPASMDDIRAAILALMAAEGWVTISDLNEQTLDIPVVFANTLNPTCEEEVIFSITFDTSIPDNPLTITCAPLVVNSDEGFCGANVTFGATVTGVPEPITITYKIGDDVITSPHYFPVGTTTVDVIAENECKTVQCSFTVTVLAPSLAEISGPANVTVGANVTYTATQLANHSYSWSITGGFGVQNAPPNDHIFEVIWDSEPGTGIITLAVTPPVPCEPYNVSYEVEIMDKALSGYITYRNVAGTPMNNVTVTLIPDGGGSALFTSTNAFGYYEFDEVPAGDYTIEISTLIPFGGVNATDALAIERRIVGLTPPFWNPMNFIDKVADVNAANGITAVDATLVKRRTVKLINSFAAGDWAFYAPADDLLFNNSNAFTASAPYSHDGIKTLNIKALCYGDVNGTYDLGSSKSLLIAHNHEVVHTAQGMEIELPLIVEQSSEFSALTLHLQYDDRLLEISEVRSELQGLVYSIQDGWIRVAWANIEPVMLNAGDNLINLVLTTLAPVNENDILFHLSTETEFAGKNGEVIDNYNLSISRIDNNMVFAIDCYPNPFNDVLNINYSITEPAHVRLSIVNNLGVVVTELANHHHEAGTFNHVFNPGVYSGYQGVYFVRLEIQGKTFTTNRLVKAIYIR